MRWKPHLKFQPQINHSLTYITKTSRDTKEPGISIWEFSLHGNNYHSVPTFCLIYVLVVGSQKSFLREIPLASCKTSIWQKKFCFSSQFVIVEEIISWANNRICKLETLLNTLPNRKENYLREQIQSVLNTALGLLTVYFLV